MRKLLLIILTLILSTLISVSCNTPVVSDPITKLEDPPALTPAEAAAKLAELQAALLATTFYSISDVVVDPYPYIGLIYYNEHKVGTGILIDPDSVLTAAHVVIEPGVYTFKVLNQINAVSKIAIHCEPDTHDIAVLTLSIPVVSPTYAVLDPGIVVPRFKWLTTVGYSFGFKKWAKPGLFLYWGILINEPNSLKVKPLAHPIWYGDSGGALIYKDPVTDQEYVIGVLAGILIFDKKVQECSAIKLSYYLPWILEEAQ